MFVGPEKPLLEDANVLTALSPNIVVMAVARFIPALALPVFWPLASEAGRHMIGPEQAPRNVVKRLIL